MRNALSSKTQYDDDIDGFIEDVTREYFPVKKLLPGQVYLDLGFDANGNRIPQRDNVDSLKGRTGETETIWITDKVKQPAKEAM